MYEAIKQKISGLRKLLTMRMRKQKGMSMIIMLILVPILLGIGVAYVNPIVRSFRAVVNDQKTLLAKSVADSMFEIALWESRGGGTGEVSEGCICSDGSCAIGSEKCADGVDFGFGTATGTWRVIGSPEVDSTHLINGEYTVPAPGSGDAGGDYCSTAEPVVDGAMLDAALTSLGIDTSVMDDPLDWPCHWNKIKEGEAVSIPLYTEEGGEVKNPGFRVDSSGNVIPGDGLGLTDFQLRYRNPCNPAVSSGLGYEICKNSNRYELKRDFLPYGFKTVILSWNITGEGMNQSGSLNEQNVLFEPFKFKDVFNYNVKVEDINNFILKNPQFWITPNSKVDFEGTINQSLSNYLSIIHKPTLNLLAIHTLKDDYNNSKIPYIEYQFKAPIDLATQSPISSTSKVVKIDVMIDGGYSESFERNIALPKPVSGFVIQQ
jgi:hypothetical protein